MDIITKRVKPGHYTVANHNGIMHLILDDESRMWRVPVGSDYVEFTQKKLAKAHAISLLESGESHSPASSSSGTERAPVEELTRSDDDIRDEQRTRFEAVEAMTRMTLEGRNKALIIGGPAGVGKSFGVEMLCEEYEDEDLIRYDAIKGYTRPIGMYTKLFEYRHEGDVMIFDDCDAVFRDEVGLNLLKVALDTSGRRVIHWNSRGVDGLTVEGRNEGETEPVPRHFTYKGTIIFISNLNFDAMVMGGGKMAPHFEALLSRCHYIDLGMATKREKLIRVLDVCESQKMLQVQCCLREQEVNDVLEFIVENHEKFREISLRMALKIGLLRASGKIEKWREMARVTCMK